MTDHTNDIDALLRYLSIINPRPVFHAALTALVAERDALQQRVEYMKALNSAAASIISERDALQQRVAELEAQSPADRDRDLRERLVCAALTGLCADPSFDGIVVRSAIELADEALAAMRKGGGA